MHRIDGDSHVSNLFDEGDPGVPRDPTQITAKWLNAVQEELCNFLVDRGITLSDANDEQLIEALHAAPSSGTGTYQKRTMTLLNTFATSGGYTVKAYRVLGGRVQLEGSAAHPTAGSGVVVFTLPTDMRPAVDRYALCYIAGDNRAARCLIQTNGNVTVNTLRNYESETLGSDAIVFDPVCFPL